MAAPSTLRTGAGAALLAILTAACWWGWMGWDDEYQVDPATGAQSGPYEAWQVRAFGAPSAAAAPDPGPTAP